MARSPKQISQFKRYQAKGTMSAFRTRMIQMIKDNEFTREERDHFYSIYNQCNIILSKWEKKR